VRVGGLLQVGDARPADHEGAARVDRLGHGRFDLRLVAYVAHDRQGLSGGGLDLLGRAEDRSLELRVRASSLDRQTLT
jgi:hypothetical protein